MDYPALIQSLLNLNGFGRKTVSKLLDFEVMNNLTSDPEEAVFSLIKRQDQFNVSLDEIKRACNDASELLTSSREIGIKTISIFDDEYPTRFRFIEDAPLLLHIKGNTKLLNNRKNITIIGTRNPSEYGYYKGAKLAKWFVERGYTTVSGLAIGCDTIAHTESVKASEKSIAVFANGLDKVYPKENRNLSEVILENEGCIVSEYAIKTRAFKNHFVERDRLQSALSEAVVVIETGIKGGTMHTVNFSRLQKKLLACLYNFPSELESVESIQGNTHLVNNGYAFPISTNRDFKNFLCKLEIRIDDFWDEKANLSKGNSSRQLNIF